MNKLTERILVPFAAITSTTPNTHTSTVLVPGHNAAQYEVIVRRGKGIITSECAKRVSCGTVSCLGNLKALCYHSRIAVMRVAHDAGYSVAFCATSGDALVLSRIGGHVYRVVSRTSNSEKWCVVSKVEAKRTEEEHEVVSYTQDGEGDGIIAH